MNRFRLALALLLLQLPVAGAPPKAAARGAIAVVSEPADCTVLIGSEARGTTPLEAELLPGDYRVTVQREGYRPEYRRVTLAAGMAGGSALPSKATRATSCRLRW